MDPENELRNLDQRSATSLSSLYARLAIRDGFAEEVVGLLGTEDIQTGATWLLKRHLEEVGVMGPGVTRDLLASLPSLISWEARLHVLQCLPYLVIEAECKPVVERFLRGNLSESNKFVRAWAYGGMHVLAGQHPEFAGEVRTLFDWALLNEAPSVKARIRRIAR